jgi:hypothetical protein
MLLLMIRQAVLVTLLAFWIPFANAHTESAESWITDIWDDFKEAVDCTSCQVSGCYGSQMLIVSPAETHV